MKVLLILVFIGILYFAYDARMDAARERERVNRARDAAALKEQELKKEEAEQIKRKDDAQKRMIDLQKEMIDLLEKKVSYVEHPSLPDEILGFTLEREYDLVNVFMPESESFSLLEVGSQLYGRKAKGNPYDDNAISLNLDSFPAAFLYRGKLQDITNTFIDRGGIVYAIVTYLNPSKKHGAVYLGLYSDPTLLND